VAVGPRQVESPTPAETGEKRECAVDTVPAPASLRSRIGSHLWDELLAGAPVVCTPAGAVLCRRGGPPTLAAVAAGVVRVFVWAPGGRQIFLRYARPGDLVGLEDLFGESDLLSAEAVTGTMLAMISVSHLHALATRHLDLSWTLAEQINAWSVASISSLLATYDHMAVRIARHLLALAVRTPDNRTIVRITHHGLARATGAVRESVTRILGEFRRKGIIDTATGYVIVLEPARLVRVAEGEPAA
jgi:CRP/FNR family transcriptional regulator, cyclic AMP receptor protein